MCRWFRGGAIAIPSAGNRWWTSGVGPSGQRCTTLVGSGVWWCRVHHTIRATSASTNTQLDGYNNSFIHSNAQLCITYNHLVVLFTVGRTWWPALLPVQGMGYGPQGQGDVWRRLQPGGPALSIHQWDCPQPPQSVHWDGKVGPWARVRSDHRRAWSRSHHEGGRRQEAWTILDCRQHARHGGYSHFSSDSSKEHELMPAYMPTTRHCTALDGDNPGYFCFIHRSLIFTYLCFAL